MNDPIACSVIVPSYRSITTIVACLSSLQQQDLALPYEIIVVDSSPDDTAKLVRERFPAVRLIQLTTQTDPATARNLGAQQANGAVLAFIDSDCTAPPDWLRRLCATLAGGYDAAGGAITNANPVNLVSWAGYMCEFREFLPGGPARDATNLTIGNTAYRCEAFWAVGGFPAGFFPQEDQIFHSRMVAAGMRIRLDPGITVAHTHRTRLGDFLLHQRQIGHANATVLQHLDLPGAGIARRPWLTAVMFPILVPLRFVRTLGACLGVERGLAVRRPLLTGLIGLGMLRWGQGFVAGTFASRRRNAVVRMQKSDLS
jgi:GT2 family glycosyltransferase